MEMRKCLGGNRFEEKCRAGDGVESIFAVRMRRLINYNTLEEIYHEITVTCSHLCFTIEQAICPDHCFR